MRVYKSRKDVFFTSLYLGILLFLTLIPFIAQETNQQSQEDWETMLIVFLLIDVLLIIPFFFLKIKIENKQIVTNVGFDVFKVKIADVTSIKIGKTMWSGFNKWGTATKGLIIFSKYKNELYITPDNQDDFIKHVLEINPKITIDDVKK